MPLDHGHVTVLLTCFSHKQFRRLVKKERRRQKRQQAAKKREQEALEGKKCLLVNQSNRGITFTTIPDTFFGTLSCLPPNIDSNDLLHGQNWFTPH